MTVFNIDTMMITKSALNQHIRKKSEGLCDTDTFYNKFKLKTSILNLNNIYNITLFTVFLK